MQILKTQSHPKFAELSKKKADDSLALLREVDFKDADIASLLENINAISFVEEDKARVNSLCIVAELGTLLAGKHPNYAPSSSSSASGKHQNGKGQAHR